MAELSFRKLRIKSQLFSRHGKRLTGSQKTIGRRNGEF
jgi:hypothetical protein